MTNRRVESFAVAVILLSSAWAFAQPDLRDHEVDSSEAALQLRNWPIDFYPMLQRSEESSPSGIAAMGESTPASHLITMVPCRVVDTRLAAGPFGGPIMASSETRSFDINNGPCVGIPGVVGAYSVNITVANPTAQGFLTAWPTGNPQPLVSTLNYRTGVNQANAAIVPADAAGSIEVFVLQQTHVIIDINGYFVQGVVTDITTTDGLQGGGTGSLTLSIAPTGVDETHLAANSVTTGAIASNAVTGTKIANGQVVRSINSARDNLTIAPGSGIAVGTVGSTITISNDRFAPAGSIILGEPNDTAITAEGYTSIGPSPLDDWQFTGGGPSGRAFHTAVWTGSRMVVWGGDNGDNLGLNTGSMFDPVANSWTATTLTGAPSARHHHSAVWTTNRMIVWGGEAGVANPYIGTGSSFDPAGAGGGTWTAISAFGAPSARSRHTAVWTGTYMIIWGGIGATPTAGTRVNTGARYRPTPNDDWASTLQDASTPAARTEHTAVWIQNAMVVWGGYNGTTVLNTGGKYNANFDSWSATPVSAFAPERSRHSAVSTDFQMLIFGGFNGADEVNTAAKYDPSVNVWTALSSVDAPAPRADHTAVWTGDHMVVFGGFNGAYLNSGGILDPFSNMWRQETSLVSPPGIRASHTAIWTGRKMVVWGGKVAATPSAVLSNGAMWTRFYFYRKT
jgi:N-acetylneuraminic acid mutarotase